MPTVERSQVDYYVELFMNVLSDVEVLCGDIDLSRERRVITARTASEGLTFLTCTLPRFTKHVISCVELGRFEPIAGFSKRRSGPLPLFLGALVSRLFSREGTLLDTPDPYAQDYIDQICGLMYKTRFGYSPSVIKRKMDEYISLDADVLTDLSSLSADGIKILDNARLFLGNYMSDFSITEYPKHGPGAVAGKEQTIDKYNFDVPFEMAEVFPLHYFFSIREIDEFGSINYFPSSPSHKLLPPARIVFVEKDSRGPRTISCEPKERQWLQQMIGRSLMSYAELHPYSRGHVNFTDQSINGEIAIKSSVTKEYATLDLKDASDRLSWALIAQIFPSTITRMLAATRSTHSELPDGRVVKLKKFAPMGSATTFPIQSIAFFSICVGAIAQRSNEDWASCARHVYVYGDDIIVPVKYADSCIAALEIFGLKVNRDKSFIHGPFRESCGRNALGGIVTTPIRLRSQFPIKRSQTDQIVSLIETSNLLFYKGFWRSSDYIVQRVESIIGLLPCVPYQSGCLGVTEYSNRFWTRKDEDPIINAEWADTKDGVDTIFAQIKQPERSRRVGSVTWNKKLQAPQIRVNRVSLEGKTVTKPVTRIYMRRVLSAQKAGKACGVFYHAEHRQEAGYIPCSTPVPLLASLLREATEMHLAAKSRLSTLGLDWKTAGRLKIRRGQIILS